MDLRFLMVDGVAVLQKYVFVRNDTDQDGNITAIYDWENVPTVTE